MRSTQLAMAVAAFASVSLAADAHFWRTQSIYQIMTDRFARTDGDVNAPCETSNNDYCGGTWKGIESQLDYIQNMGFTAVCYSFYYHWLPSCVEARGIATVFDVLRV